MKHISVTAWMVGGLASVVAVLHCGQTNDSQEGQSPVRARIAPAPLPANKLLCMHGTDADGDGQTDYFDMSRARFFKTPSAKSCFARGGTVFEVWSSSSRPLTLANRAPQGPAVPPPNNYQEGGDLPPGVSQDVHNSGVPDPEGWRQDHNDCDDFASDLERALHREGYNSTYTEICVPTSSTATWHALTDVHLDGVTYWIDGQTGHQFKLDANGDGTVNTSTSGSPCDGTSEGAYNIRVWPDRAARILEIGAVD